MPDKLGRSLSQWDCAEIGRQLVDSGVVTSISSETVRRILANHKLKPWRKKMWLSPKTPRDAEFVARVTELVDLYTRPLQAHEMVLCADEKTSLQPRPRLADTLPAKPGEPVRVEHEYRREGALNLFAAFDARSGTVYGLCRDRKRQTEFIEFLEMLDAQIPPEITLVHVVLDNLIMHKGKQVKAWLERHPRFQFHFTPVHCSWMNQVEQWFGVLQRKRLSIANFDSKQDLENKLMNYIAEHNLRAHPYNWTAKSAAKIMAKVASAHRSAA
jgi:hypothetical protein